MAAIYRRMKTINPTVLRRETKSTLEGLSEIPVLVVSHDGTQLGVLLHPEAYDDLVSQLEEALSAVELLRANAQVEAGGGTSLEEELAARAHRSAR